jgi:hypothetical protein
MSITLGVSSVMSKSYRQMIDRRTTNGGVCAAHLRWTCGVRPALDGRLLAYFVAVAEELHFGRAAARVHIEQPSLSVQIRKLEYSLNTPLRFGRAVASSSLPPMKYSSTAASVFSPRPNKSHL